MGNNLVTVQTLLDGELAIPNNSALSNLLIMLTNEIND